jgi:hypothetical protein
MKAYVIALETVHDEAMFAEYRKGVVGTVATFGGQFIARGGKFTVLEGQWPENHRTSPQELARRSGDFGRRLIGDWLRSFRKCSGRCATGPRWDRQE